MVSRRGKELVTADEFHRRSRSCTPAAPHMSGQNPYARESVSNMFSPSEIHSAEVLRREG